MFEVGHVYKRSSEIHDVYGGQRQGGISTPKNQPHIFIFTSDAGEAHGYKDEFKSDGLFWYTGEGQYGDMSLSGGNKALKNHRENNKKIYLFEYVKKSYVRFVGTAEYIGYHMDTRPDTNGDPRQALVFHLYIDSIGNQLGKFDHVQESSPEYSTGSIKSRLKKKSLQELRDVSIASLPQMKGQKETIRAIYYRSEAIRYYVLGRAKGNCEGCSTLAPFKAKSGPYLECHHITRVSDGGPDHPLNVIALCPNCHRRAHYSIEAEAFNSLLKNRAREIELQMV